MSRTMIQAAVTMNQLQNKLDLIGHNLANSQTTGYKSRQTEFSSLLFQQINNLTDPANADGRLTPDGIRIGSGARLGSINLDLSVGSQTVTNRELDTALLGDNYLFQIEVENDGASEVQYTRDGAFYLNPTTNDGQILMLTTKDGHPVLGMNGPIVMNSGFDNISINQNGEVVVQRGSQTEVVGQISVVEALRPRLLEAAGENNFRMPNLEQLNLNINEMIEPVQINANVLESGALENSNVDISKQMTDLLMTQRSYQFNARTISMSDQMQGLINQLR